MSLRPNTVLVFMIRKPGMPASVTSKGMVTWRSTSSADAPENCATTSTVGGAGSG